MILGTSGIICIAVMETEPDKTSRKLKELITKIIFPGKKNTFAFKGLTLYPAETHLIPVMDETPTNAGRMARMRF